MISQLQFSLPVCTTNQDPPPRLRRIADGERRCEKLPVIEEALGFRLDHDSQREKNDKNGERDRRE